LRLNQSNPGTPHQDQNCSGAGQHMSKQLPKRKFRSATRQSMGSVLKKFYMVSHGLFCIHHLTCFLKLSYGMAFRKHISIPPHHTPNIKANFL